MSNLIIRAENIQVEIPHLDKLQITKGDLTLTLSFNDKGGFSLAQNEVEVALSWPPPKTTREMVKDRLRKSRERSKGRTRHRFVRE